MQINKSVIINNNRIEQNPFKYESHMAGFILENTSILMIDQLGLTEPEIIGTEIHLKGNGGSSRIDFAVKYESDLIGIVELKNIELSLKHFDQLTKYMKSENLTKEINGKISEEDFRIKAGDRFIGVLVGTSISAELRSKIENEKDNVHKINAIVVKRYKHENVVYTVTESIATYKKNSKNFTQYSFLNNAPVGKSRLVLNIVRHVLNTKNCKDFKEALKLFPDILNGKNVIAMLVDANINFENTGYKRYFFDDVILLNDGTKIVVSNQWGKGNIEKFIKHCSSNLKLEITSI